MAAEDILGLVYEGDLEGVKQAVEECGNHILHSFNVWFLFTTMHQACHSGSLPMVQYLVESRVMLEYPDSTGQTPLHVAIKEGHLEIVQYLEAHGAIHMHARDGVVPATHRIGRVERSPLQIASYHGHESIVKYLVEEREADIKYRNFLGHTALDEARTKGHTDVVNYLERVDKVRKCHSLIGFLLKRGFWDKKDLKRKSQNYQLDCQS